MNLNTTCKYAEITFLIYFAEYLINIKKLNRRKDELKFLTFYSNELTR